MGAQDAEAEGEFVFQGPVGQVHILKGVGAVGHRVGDHVGKLPVGAVLVDPVGQGVDLVDVGAVVDQVVQPDELLHRVGLDAVKEEVGQGDDGEGGQPGRQAEGQRQHPVPQLEIPQPVQGVGQGGGARQHQDEIPRHQQQRLVRPHVLDPCEQHQAEGQHRQGLEGQSPPAPGEGPHRPGDHQRQIEDPQPEDLGKQLQGQAPHIVGGVVGLIAVGEDFLDDGPEQHQDGRQGPGAEGDEPADAVQRLAALAFADQQGGAARHRQGIHQIVGYNEIEVPPAGQHQGGGGEKQSHAAGRLPGVKPEVDGQQQDDEGEDQAEPVGLAQGGGHPQQREAGGGAEADEEKALVVPDRQQLAHLDHQAPQGHQQGGEDADQLAEDIAVPGVGRQAEGKLGEQADEAGVVLGEGGDQMPQPRQGPALEGGLGLVLEEGVVAVVPDINKGAAVHLEVEADGHQQIHRHQDRPVEQLKMNPCPADRRQGETEQKTVRPQTEQRKKEGAGEACGGAAAQQDQRQGEGRGHDAPAQPQPRPG